MFCANSQDVQYRSEKEQLLYIMTKHLTMLIYVWQRSDSNLETRLEKHVKVCVGDFQSCVSATCLHYLRWRGLS